MKSLEAKFGDLLRELREKKGLTQEELGTDAELDRTYISLLERGLRQPTLHTIFNLAKALGVTPSSIIKRLEEH
jgi:transcriptional regulator with XRE-family HTH domain